MKEKRSDFIKKFLAVIVLVIASNVVYSQKAILELQLVQLEKKKH